MNYAPTKFEMDDNFVSLPSSSCCFNWQRSNERTFKLLDSSTFHFRRASLTQQVLRLLRPQQANSVTSKKSLLVGGSFLC